MIEAQPTPRTDAFFGAGDGIFWNGIQYVPASFARELERALRGAGKVIDCPSCGRAALEHQIGGERVVVCPCFDPAQPQHNGNDDHDEGEPRIREGECEPKCAPTTGDAQDGGE